MVTEAHHPREREVLILAVRNQLGSGDPARLEQLLEEGVDWTTLVRTAIDHRLVPILGVGLRPCGAPLVPDDITDALAVWSDRSLTRYRALQDMVSDLSGELKKQRLRALCLQGPVSARQIDGDLHLQQATDPVFLLRERDLDAFDVLLRGRDYQWRKTNWPGGKARPALAVANQRVYMRAADESTVEVCTSMLATGHGMVLDEDGFWERAVEYELDGVQVTAPGIEDMLLMSCATGGIREWSVFGDLCDVARLLNNHPEIALAKVLERARPQGIERLLRLGLGLTERVLGLSLPDYPADDSRLHRLVSDIASRLMAAPTSETSDSGLSIRQLRLRERWADRSRYLAQGVLTACRAGFSGRDVEDDSQRASSASIKNKIHWGRRSDAWEKWSEPSRPRSSEFSRALIDAAGIEVGHRVLDLACGVGDTALELSPLVGPRGRVIAADLALDMVDRARRRAEAEDLTNLQFSAAAMEQLPFVDNCLDGIVCRLGIMYCPLVQQALAEARRVLRPGARAAFLVCGPRDNNPILKIVNDVATELFKLKKSDEAIDPFRFAAAGSLEQELASAGFSEVSAVDVVLGQRAPAGSRFWQASLERGLGLPLETLPKDTRQVLEQRMADAFAPFLTQGFYALPSLSRIVYGMRP